MELWVIITVAAAFFQNIRSTVQKHLKGVMSTAGATFVRFGYGVPFALLYFLVFLVAFEANWPAIKPVFLLWVTIAALSQILATALLLHVFSFRNFAVGTAYSRTEPIQTAIFALVLFGETLNSGGLLAIATSIAGVMVISIARTELNLGSLIASITSQTAIYGIASGSLFGLAAVSYRAATQSVVHDLFFIRSAVTLCAAIIMQTIVMLTWIAWKEREQLANIAKAWKPSVLVGFVGATASFGWFTAFTLQQAALVKVVAQIELLFTFGSSVFFFREHINRLEIAGCILITAGIVLLVLVG